MLCPNCGADVGEELSLCANCNAKQEAERAMLEEPSEGPETFEADEEDDEGGPPANRKALMIAAVAGSAVIVLVLAVAFIFTAGDQAQQGTGGAVAPEPPIALGSQTSEGEQPGEAVESPDGDESAATPTTGVPPKNMVGALKVDDKLSYFTEQVALFNPLSSKLEIGFYETAVTPEQRTELELLPSLGMYDKKLPGALVSLFFERSSRSCEKKGLLAYQIELPETESVAQFQEDLSGIEGLACQFMGGALVRAGFKHETKIGDEQAAWELRANTSILVSQAIGRVSYRSSEAKSKVAIWNKPKSTVSVGFFGQEVTNEEKLKIRQERSLTALPEKHPAVVVTFEIKPAAGDDLDLGDVEKYGVTFYRSEADGIDFSGGTDSVSFYYLLRGNETSQRLSKLSGYFAEGEPLAGALKHTAEKRMDLARYEFSWDIDFYATLMDLDSEPLPVAEEGEGGYFARASIDSMPVEFKSVVALYYPEGRDITVGLYVDSLTAEEMEQVRRNRAVHTYVNNKRPNLVLRFDLKQDADTVNTANLLYYEATFLRDPVGSFYFPGANDRITFQRTAEKMRPGEVGVLEGELVDKNLLKLRVRAKQRSASIKTMFSWQVNIITPLQVLK